jgi:hypothetical protein
MKPCSDPICRLVDLPAAEFAGSYLHLDLRPIRAEEDRRLSGTPSAFTIANGLILLRPVGAEGLGHVWPQATSSIGVIRGRGGRPAKD